MNAFFNMHIPLLQGIAIIVSSGVLVLSILVFLMIKAKK